MDVISNIFRLNKSLQKVDKACSHQQSQRHNEVTRLVGGLQIESNRPIPSLKQTKQHLKTVPANKQITEDMSD